MTPRVGTLIYDLAHNPPTFNKLDCLLQGDRWCRLQGFERLEVKVLPGPADGFRADRLPPYGGAERRRWLSNIVLPLPVLLPSCGRPAEIVGREHRGAHEFGRDAYTVGPATWVEAFRDGDFPFRVPPGVAALRTVPRPYVTLTLRNTGWWPERSADFGQWAIVGRELQRQGFGVVVIPDGARPDEGLDGFDNDRGAAENVLERAALYAGAALNLGIGGGPMWLAWFLGLPVLICKFMNANEPCSGLGIWQRLGVAPGEQPRHARPRQRLVWASDQAETILQHAGELLAE